MGVTIQLAVLTAAVALFFFLRGLSSKKTLAPLPPGPPKKPLIGNLLDLPGAGQQEWIHWLKHKDLYGPLSSVSVFGQNIILINDKRIAYEILEKNSAKHSSRPHFTFAEQICGWDRAPVNQDNNAFLKTFRRAAARTIGTQASIAKYDRLIEDEMRHFLWRVLDNPKKFIDHNRSAAVGLILKITYGYTTEPSKEDPLVALADLTLQQFSEAIIPGAFLVDLIPALIYIPEWFPGGGFKTIGRFYYDTLRRLVESPFAFTKYQKSQNISKNPSLVSELLDQGEDDDLVKWLAVGLYGGGADTTVSTMEAFFLAMLLYPEVQGKAQAELDHVLGETTLPTVADRPKLPYINAIVRELLRWHPVAPLGVPHRADEDDIINGFLIPKNAVLIANIWGFNHDPEVYSNPSQFKPERFLGVDDKDAVPDSQSFGFGRRICPGRLFADTSLYIMVAHTLSVFNLNKAVGEDGREIDVEAKFTAGIISHPEPFSCAFTPRSESHKQLIEEFQRENPFKKGNADELLAALNERNVSHNDGRAS
ncbi:hypothetical protein N7495_007532 [Penicillium taxi]|uniref:uncharacterized protein n=1 Tax=Penicillium taxi TaxID=168475 RepID=UPI002544EF16|nr:uncharacterized protein N7495_007532 [Penicillium taxi]KAJ5887491.1 hypothetical protein N7495_007532 [Penicillium taxi]